MILPANWPMRHVCKKLGFTCEGETGATKVLAQGLRA